MILVDVFFSEIRIWSRCILISFRTVSVRELAVSSEKDDYVIVKQTVGFSKGLVTYRKYGVNIRLFQNREY